MNQKSEFFKKKKLKLKTQLQDEVKEIKRGRKSKEKISKHEENQMLLSVLQDKKKGVDEEVSSVEQEVRQEARQEFICTCGYKVRVEGDFSCVKSDKENNFLCSKCSDKNKY